MNEDFKKWIICSSIGEVLGILLSIKLSNALFLLMGPLYIVGFIYGAGKFYPWFLSVIGAIGKASFLAFLASKPLLGILILAFLCVCGGAIVGIGWLIGLAMAVIALIHAIVEAVHEGSSRRVPYIPASGEDWEKIETDPPKYELGGLQDEYTPDQLENGNSDGFADDFWNAAEEPIDSNSFGMTDLPDETTFGEDGGDSFWG